MRRSRFALCLLVGITGVSAPLMRAQAQIAIGVSITVAPPVLPVYVQPAIPEPGYIWTPGYWAWGSYGYYWVPGTWILPPVAGVLWTPGYWGWGDGAYDWHPGYWGPNVGFYGGVNYGYGYGGSGYQGGYWNHNQFFYNRSVNNVTDVHITNVYNKTIINNVYVTRVSYNGGQGGLQARPSPQELSYGNEHHYAPTTLQVQHEHVASGNHAQLASVNHGRPPIGATPRAADFSSHAAAPAEHPPGMTNKGQHGAAEGQRPEQHEPGPNQAAEHPGYNPGSAGHPAESGAHISAPPGHESSYAAPHPEVSHPEESGGGYHPEQASHPVERPKQAPHPAEHPGGGGDQHHTPPG